MTQPEHSQHKLEREVTTKSPVGGDDDTSARDSSSGVSPYATGGGGVTFERKVAV